MSARSVWLRAAVSLAATWVVSASAVSHAATLRVGAGEMYATAAAAATASRDGDVIEIRPGTYREEVVWARNGLTIRAMPGGRVIFDRTGMPLANQGGKGIFILDGADTTVEGIEFVGAACGSRNGAGIRWQGMGRLTVRGSVFRDNENGILGGNHSTNVAVIEGNEFVGNGRGDLGFTHNLYINEIQELRFVGNWSHALYTAGADVGHLFKSRARLNYVAYNRLTAESNYSSFELQLTGGGVGYIIGNVIHQGRMTRNNAVIAIGGDGTQHPNGRIFIVNNTIVNELGAGTIVSVRAQPSLPVRMVNNLIVGGGTLAEGAMFTMMNNVSTATPGFVNSAAYDYRLTPGSPAVDTGVDPGMDGTVSLAPVSEYVHPRAVAPRGRSGAMDVGAYELAGAAMTDGGTAPVPDASLRPDAAIPSADGGVSFQDGAIAPFEDGSTVERDVVGVMDAVSPATDSGGAPRADAASTVDGAVADGGASPMTPSGCGCRVDGPPAQGSAFGAPSVLALVAGALALSRRRARLSR
jgi:MYXO-CTERM domain-containing protein